MFKHLEEIFNKKDKAYGKAYQKFGELCDVIFPDGLNLKGRDDFILFGIYMQWLEKCLRVSNIVFKDGQKNFESVEDSCDDLSILSQMFKNEMEKK